MLVKWGIWDCGCYFLEFFFLFCVFVFELWCRGLCWWGFWVFLNFLFCRIKLFFLKLFLFFVYDEIVNGIVKEEFGIGMDVGILYGIGVFCEFFLGFVFFEIVFLKFLWKVIFFMFKFCDILGSFFCLFYIIFFFLLLILSFCEFLFFFLIIGVLIWDFDGIIKFLEIGCYLFFLWFCFDCKLWFCCWGFWMLIEFVFFVFSWLFFFLIIVLIGVVYVIVWFYWYKVCRKESEGYEIVDGVVFV